MAPEVAKEEPYDKSVDAYSFGIFLWELCSCKKPYFGYSSSEHMNKVVNGGERPQMDAEHTRAWPLNLQWLMKRCWSTNSDRRPSFTVIQETLDDILAGIESIPANMMSEEDEGITAAAAAAATTISPKGSFQFMLHPKWGQSESARVQPNSSSQQTCNPKKKGKKKWAPRLSLYR